MDDVKIISSPDGLCELRIRRGSHGLFSFCEMFWEAADEYERNVIGEDGHWNMRHFSGLYECGEAAERDARCVIAWLKPSQVEDDDAP
jgi:hypothetical protein